MKANKLFLFRPAVNWNRCGGAMIVCANFVEEAILLGNMYWKGGKDCDYTLSLNEPTNINSNYCIWVFTKEFALAEEQEVGVVFQDYNYV